jgi:hypothetical protein
MNDTEKKLDAKTVASARRRLGFVSLLWWIAAIFGTLGLIQGLDASLARKIFIGVAWVLAIFFSYAWWQVRSGKVQR